MSIFINKTFQFFKSAMATQAAARMVSLDLLRAIAIILVLFRHSNIDALSSADSSNGFAGLVLWLKQVGWAGVDLFFVLSGFLIGGLLFKEYKVTGTIDSKCFWVRRALKVFPLYYFYILLVGVMTLIRSDFDFGHVFNRIWPNLINIQNYLWTPAGHTWSLAIEEHFYLFLPLLCWGSLGLWGNLRNVVKALVLCLVGCFLMQFMYWRAGGQYSHEAVLWPTHLRIDGLAYGVIIAYLWNFGNSNIRVFARLHRWAIFSAGLVLLSPHFFWGLEVPKMWVFGFSLNYLAFGCILIFCIVSEAELAGVEAFRWLARMGAYSYPIYLFHFGLSEPLVVYLNNQQFWVGVPIAKWLLVFSVYICVSVVSGFLLNRLVETPVLYLRDKYFPALRRASN